MTDETISEAKSVLDQINGKLPEFERIDNAFGAAQVKKRENVINSMQRTTTQENVAMTDADAPPAEDIDATIAQLTDEKSRLETELAALFNTFYTLIPSAQFRRGQISSITRKETYRQALATISQLIDVHIATKLIMAARWDILHCSTRKSTLREPLSIAAPINPIDYCLFGLGADIRQISEGETEYRMIHDYMYQSAKSTEWEIYNIYAVRRRGEEERFAPHKAMSNRMLLWHGSPTANYAGLLSQGLRIAPPEADSTGSMFGRGIYAADQFQKSIAYCGWSMNHLQHYESHRLRQDDLKRSKLLILTEVALGRMNELFRGEYLEEAAPNTDSTLGRGHSGPDMTQSLVSVDGLIIPSGPIIQHKTESSDPQKQPQLGMNEYIVYKESQCVLRYILCVGPPRTAQQKEETARNQKKFESGQIAIDADQTSSSQTNDNEDDGNENEDNDEYMDEDDEDEDMDEDD